MSIIQIRDINTGQVIKAQQISDDAGTQQKEDLAQRLSNQVENHKDFMYAVEVSHGIARRKWEL